MKELYFYSTKLYPECTAVDLLLNYYDNKMKSLQDEPPCRVIKIKVERRNAESFKENYKKKKRCQKTRIEMEVEKNAHISVDAGTSALRRVFEPQRTLF